MEPQTDWERLRTQSAADIRKAILSDPDAAPPTDEAFWRGAKVVYPKPKETITIRLDADLLAWLRRESGYQTKVNSVLRAYMNAQKKG